ncbi:MAG TPA: futalosine hydrolase [Bacteroidales bacterium]|jgi:futalosine hydrolase|nr:futalosine hydrolase [Bacteroidales bacterium]
MKILIVSATAKEIQPLLSSFGNTLVNAGKCEVFGNHLHEIHILVTGAGMVATAYHLGKQFVNQQYNLAVNAGICGSFNREIPVGEVVNVTTDSFADMGAENHDSWLTMADLGLLADQNEVFSEGGTLRATSGLECNLLAVTGVTVNTVHGNSLSISRFTNRSKADTESMEGAAFLYACALAGCKSLQIRSVSNYVEPRDVSKWNIGKAISNLNQELLQLLSNEIRI